MKPMKSNSKGTNGIKEPSKFSVKFANMVFAFAGLFSVLLTTYAVYKLFIFHVPVIYITSILAGLNSKIRRLTILKTI